MAEPSTIEREYLSGQRLGRIATAGRDHKPHVVPVSYHYNETEHSVDIGGHRMATTKKYRDVQHNGWAALVVDELVSISPWIVHMVEVRGRAEAVPTGGSALGPGFGDAFIRIHLDRVVSFGLDEAGTDEATADDAAPEEQRT